MARGDGILFLAHRLPFPPDRGDKIRSHNVLKALAQLAPVHVGCFAEGATDMANEGELAAMSDSHFLPLRRKSLLLSGAEALMRREAVSLAAFRHSELAQWVERTLRRGDIGTIYVFSGQMGQYVPDWWQGRVVVDLVDVDSAKFETYAETGSGPMRWINAREGRLLKREEVRLATAAHHTLLISEAEADLLRSRLPGDCPARVSALGNGIDAGFFDPSISTPMDDTGPGPRIIFTGQMDYQPNVEAVLRAVRHIMPAVRQVHPTARLHVVGRSPVPELLALHGKDGVCVWGEVPDVRPYLAGADVVLAPLLLARGVQNKVLEAMAMARPVVLSRPAATGISATNGTHFLIGDDDAALAAHVLSVLADRGRASDIGTAARSFVVDTMTWPAMLAGLPRLIRAGNPLADAA